MTESVPGDLFVTGDGQCQYCPRCGAVARVIPAAQGSIRACKWCSWKVKWAGPLWGAGVRKEWTP